MMREKVIEYYKVLLELGWMVADDVGLVSVKLGDETMPATLNGKRLVLPTVEQMKIKEWKDRVGFHPLRESFNLGISDVLASLRDQYVQRLNTSISYFMKEMIALSYDQENQKNLTVEQSSVLNTLSKCDKVTVKQFESMMRKIKSKNDASQFINIFIKRAGTVNGVVHNRAAIVTFPIYEELLKDKETINGVKLSQKDRAMFIKLHEFIFPTLKTNKECFNVGVNTKTAPFLESLVKSTIEVVDQLVESSQPYMDIIDLPYILTFPDGITMWKTVFEDQKLLERLSKSIPALNANELGEIDTTSYVSEEPRKENKRMPVEDELIKEKDVVVESKPRGRMIIGYPSVVIPNRKPTTADDHKTKPNVQSIPINRVTLQDTAEYRKLQEEKRRVEEKEAELKRKERELEDLERNRKRDDRYDDRRYDDRRYDDRDGRRDPPRKTGDVFEDNPILRAHSRDDRDLDRDRRPRYDPRDPRNDPRNRRFNSRDPYYDRDYGRRGGY